MSQTLITVRRRQYSVSTRRWGSWGVEKAVWFAWLAFLAVCGILTFSQNNVSSSNTSHSLRVSIIYQVHNLQLIVLDSAGKVY